MKELKLIDRVVVEIKGEEDSQSRNTQMAALLQDVSEQILNGVKGNESLHTSPIGIRTEVLWERECTDFGFRMGDKSLICQYYYGSESKPHVVSDKLRNEIREYLDSFGDDEQLSVEDMSDLFFRANTLLVNVLEGK